MEDTQTKRPTVNVDGVDTAIDTLPVELQRLLVQVSQLRVKRDEAALNHVAMQRAVEHAETQVVEGVRAHRAKEAANSTEAEVVQ